MSTMPAEALSYDLVWPIVIAIQITLLVTQSNILGIIRHARSLQLPHHVTKIPTWIYIALFFVAIRSNILQIGLAVALPALWLYIRENHRESTLKVTNRLDTAIRTANHAIAKINAARSKANEYERRALDITAAASQLNREMQTVRAGDYYDKTADAWGILSGIATTMNDLSETANLVEERAYQAQDEAQRLADERQAATARETAGAEIPAVPSGPLPGLGGVGSPGGGGDSESDPSTDSAVLATHGFYEQAALAGEAARDAKRKAMDVRFQVKSFGEVCKRNETARSDIAAYAKAAVETLEKFMEDLATMQESGDEAITGAEYIRGACAAECSMLAAEGKLGQALTWADTAEKTVFDVEAAAQKVQELADGLGEKLMALLQLKAKQPVAQ